MLTGTSETNLPPYVPEDDDINENFCTCLQFHDAMLGSVHSANIWGQLIKGGRPALCNVLEDDSAKTVPSIWSES